MATEDVTQTTPSVDETPISPSRPNAGRKNSLEEHLKHRPERHELIESMSMIPELGLDPGRAHSSACAHR